MNRELWVLIMSRNAAFAHGMMPRKALRMDLLREREKLDPESVVMILEVERRLASR